ncbi:MAG: DEAD/DEAH box helicase family protein [Candidatus Sabulitectum sp.]|nr:DEAD/DEAH box helicase family protein [Candidatus Sabulitectum sp.]
MKTDLSSYPFGILYNTADDPLNSFYIPALERSVLVVRGTGYYTSTSLAVAAAGVSRLVHNGGRMEIFCGAQLSPNDVEAIAKGESLENAVGRGLADSLFVPVEDEFRTARLSVLAWMIAEGRLDIHVVLSVDGDGKPVPASKAQEYFHPKMGLFLDSSGNSMSMYGSVNETETGWTRNYENFQVNCSWDREDVPAGKAFINRAKQEFNRLRNNEAAGWHVMPIPKAAKQKLLKYCPTSKPPVLDPLELQIGKVEPKPSINQIKAAFLRDAPRMPWASWLGAASSTVSPWPHQRKIYSGVVASYPNNYLFCDEVGLGKTIEAGLVLRQLIISKRIKRCLLLVPRAVQKQWQEEMWEKFSLNIPLYAGGIVKDVFGEKLSFDSSKGAWNSFDMLIATSHLAKRAERRPELLEADKWDLVIVDEAHHARRKDFLNTDLYRPNSLLTLLTGRDGNGGLVQNTKCIYLLTATPMQVNPVEVWDLLKVLGMGGRWGARKENFLRFFEEVRLPFEARNWQFLLAMTKDCIDGGIPIDPVVAVMAENRLGYVECQRLVNLTSGNSSTFSHHNLSEDSLAVLDHVIKSTTPIRGMMWRNTRNLLREYKKKGLLDAIVPVREPRNQWIDLEDSEEDSEWALYCKIEEYISDFYKKYEEKRKGLGFVMTVYRKRLTSSFYALEKSMERRLAYLNNTLAGDDLLSDEDFEEGSFFEDEDVDIQAEEDLSTEIFYVEEFLRGLKNLSGDSKYNQLVDDIDYFFRLRDTIIIFTQYTDTMDYLRENLKHVYGKKVACYSGRGGERWTGSQWLLVPKEEIKGDFRAGDELKILLCTESASEGLNLQTCGVLINYDMPWNPMRVEQRIGRIDRIGQRFDKVWIRNYFITDTVEAQVYQRLEQRIGDFTAVVGRLQPILHGIEETIKTVSMAGGSDRDRILAKKLDEIEKQLEDNRLRDFDLNDFVESDSDSNSITELPATLEDIEDCLLNNGIPGVSIEPSEEENIWNLTFEGSEYSVTFQSEVFDEYPNSVQMLTWGNPLFERIISKAVHGSETDKEGFLSISSKHTSIWLRPNETKDVVSLNNVSELEPSSEMEWSDSSEICASRVFSELVKNEDFDRQASSENKNTWQKSRLLIEAKEILADAVFMMVADMSSKFQFESSGSNLTKEAFNKLLEIGYPWKGLVSVVGILDTVTINSINDRLSAESLERKPWLKNLEKLKGRARSMLHRILDSRKKVIDRTTKHVMKRFYGSS